MELQFYCHQTVPVPGSSDGVWIQKLDRCRHYAAGSGCRHRGDGGLPGALHLVQRPGGGPAKWQHLSGEQGVCRAPTAAPWEAPSGLVATPISSSETKLTWVGGKCNFKATIHTFPCIAMCGHWCALNNFLVSYFLATCSSNL